MSKRGKLRVPSDAEEARTAAGIAVDPNNPEWTAEDFRRAKPFAKMFPPSRRADGYAGHKERRRKSLSRYA
jgi:hypothetical protein